MLSAEDDGKEERIGGYRETKRGIDAYATTFGYEPGRSQKGFETIEEAKAFVESFQPWNLFEGAEDSTVEPEVRPLLDAPSAGTSDTPDQSAEVSTPDQPADISTADEPTDISTPDQPAEVSTPDQPADISTPDEPTDISTPDQPAEVSTPDQPADISTPDEPTDISTPDQPAEVSTADLSAESIAPEPQPRKRWWEFWKGS